jgi:hypothetical protein
MFEWIIQCRSRSSATCWQHCNWLVFWVVIFIPLMIVKVEVPRSSVFKSWFFKCGTVWIFLYQVCTSSSLACESVPLHVYQWRTGNLTVDTFPVLPCSNYWKCAMCMNEKGQAATGKSWWWQCIHSIGSTQWWLKIVVRCPGASRLCLQSGFPWTRYLGGIWLSIWG